MVSEDVDTRIQSGNVVWTASQRCFDLNGLGPVSIQNSHSNGGSIKVLLGPRGRVVHLLTAGHFSPGKMSPWHGHTLLDQGPETTESVCISFINQPMAFSNWVDVETHAGMLGLDALAAGTSWITLSDHEAPGPNRPRHSNFPMASVVDEHLIEEISYRGFTHIPTVAKAMGVGLIQLEATHEISEASTETIDADRGADQAQDVIETLKSSGWVSFADRIEYLNNELDEDPEEPQLSLGSLKTFNRFVQSSSMPGSPQVWVDSNGYVGLQWRIPEPDRHLNLRGSQPVTRADDHLWGKGDGILLLVFLPSGRIKYSGTSGPVGKGLGRTRVDGDDPPAVTLKKIEPFLSRIATL